MTLNNTLWHFMTLNNALWHLISLYNAPDLRPSDGHVLCSHIDALYLISNTAALNLCCRLWLSRPESDPVSALPVYAEIRPRIASRSSAWVMCHSCSIVAWGVGSGTGKQRWWWLWLVTTPLCTYPFEASLIAQWLKCSVSLHGTILLRIRYPAMDMCCVVT